MLSLCASPRQTATTTFVALLLSADIVSSGAANSYALRAFGRPSSIYQTSSVSVRGGSTSVLEDGAEEDKEIDPEEEKKRLAVRKWRMDQQQLMQLRGYLLSEVLAVRDFPMTTLVDVSTPEGDKPPASVDWDCAMSTYEEPKSCLFSLDAEPNTKVIAPLGTTDWMTLSALNRLRRDDPTKVELMWHSKYAILKSWFGEDSEYSVFQHVGVQGFITTVLLDSAGGMVLRSLLIVSVVSAVILLLPVIELVMSRVLVSAQLWARWSSWNRFAHASMPLKLWFFQMLWQLLAKSIGKLEAKVRGYVVDMECNILEQNIPLTVGPGSEDPVVEEDEEEQNQDREDDGSIAEVFVSDSESLSEAAEVSDMEMDQDEDLEAEDYDSYDDS